MGIPEQTRKSAHQPYEGCTMSKETAVKKHEEQPLATPFGLLTEMPEHVKNTTGLGQENVTADDIGIPQIVVIQALSPQRQKMDPAYVPGLEEGDLFNSLTKTKMESPLLWVDCFFKKQWTVGVNRKKDSKGGLISNHPTKEEADAVAAAHPNAANLEVFETRIQGGVILDKNGVPVNKAIIYFAKSKGKVSKAMNAILDGFGVDRWSVVWELSTVTEKDRQSGQNYFNFSAKQAGWTPKPLMDQFKAFNDQLNRANLTFTAKDIDAATSGEPGEDRF